MLPSYGTVGKDEGGKKRKSSAGVLFAGLGAVFCVAVICFVASSRASATVLSFWDAGKESVRKMLDV